MTPSELNQELETGQFRPIYYFYGSEDYRIKEAEKAVVRKFLPRPQATTNHIVLSAAKGRLSDILTELSIVPMLGERQVFTIGDVQSFSPAEIEKVLSLLRPPDPNRVVIMTTPSAKAPKKKSKILELFLAKTAAIEFERIPDDIARRKISSFLRDQEIDIEPEAESILVMLTGGDLGGLTEELNKLASYVGRGGTVTKEVVSSISSDYQAYQVYELGNQVAAGEYELALAIIGTLTRQGERASTLLFWMGEHFLDLYLTKNRKPLSGWKKNLAFRLNRQAELFTNEQLEQIILFLAEADSDLRGNIRPEELILERLVLRICDLRRE